MITRRYATSIFSMILLALGAIIIGQQGADPPTAQAADGTPGEAVSVAKAAMLADPQDAKSIAAAHGEDWCRTQIVYDQRYPATAKGPAACPPRGPCDDPTTRDANIPKGTDVPITIKLKINVFRNSDGSSPAASAADVDAQMVTLNADFSPSRIQFIHTWEYIDNSTYRNFSDSEEWSMKNTYADNPSLQLNVYVVNIQGPYIGVGTFPWDPVVLGNLGGTIVDDNWFGNNEHTLTHEIGHCLGLWHTHHGVSEVSTCGPCYERADGFEGDVTGDYCSDTRPTPTNFNCGGPGGTDGCSGVGWNPTDVQNYMGYAPDWCYEEFSPHQWGRMHCWTLDVLSSWLGARADFVADTIFGQDGPLNVQFTDLSDENTTSWIWDLGDGDSSLLENPLHTYQPGLYDVSLRTTTPFADAYELKQYYIAVAADTMVVNDTTLQPNTSAYWEIHLTNAVGIDELIIPVQLSNVPSVVLLDSLSTVGCRTNYFEYQENVFDNKFAGELAIRLRADNGGGSPLLAPGSGPVLRVYFRTKVNATAGQTSSMSFPALWVYSLTASCPPADYVPVLYSGTMTIAGPPYIVGDLNGDNNIDVLDVTAIIDYVFRSGAAPDPVARGNVNCDASVNVLDVTALIEYVFRSGSPPVDPCP